MPANRGNGHAEPSCRRSPPAYAVGSVPTRCPEGPRTDVKAGAGRGRGVGASPCFTWSEAPPRQRTLVRSPALVASSMAPAKIPGHHETLLEGGGDIVPQAVLTRARAVQAVACVPKAIASRGQGADPAVGQRRRRPPVHSECHAPAQVSGDVRSHDGCTAASFRAGPLVSRETARIKLGPPMSLFHVNHPGATSPASVGEGSRRSGYNGAPPTRRCRCHVGGPTDLVRKPTRRGFLALPNCRSGIARRSEDGARATRPDTASYSSRYRQKG
jgi:hypothetical protein